VFDIDLMSGPASRGLEFIEDCNAAREHSPVFWSELSNTWIIGRHADVSDGFRGRKPLINRGRLFTFALGAVSPDQRAKLLPNMHRYMPSWILEVDPPDHTRLRRLVMVAFTKRIVENMRGTIRARVDELLDYAESSREVEFNEKIARLLPGYIVFKMLGMPEKYMADLREWSNALVLALSRPGTSIEELRACDEAIAQMNRIVLEELEKRRTAPQDDLLTELLHATDEGDKLTIEELLGVMHILIVAGHDTTANTMTLITEALSRRPDAWDYIRDNPDQILACVNELMRYVAMSAGQPKFVGADFEWHGQQLRKGQPVVLLIAGANRDPRVFDNPEALDFSRNNIDSQVFAPGIHHCIGHLLAKLQLCEFVSALVNRFESVQVLDDPLNFMPTFAFRGMWGMNVRFQTRAPNQLTNSSSA